MVEIEAHGIINEDSTMKPSLVIINSEQFGYHSDTYYYCKHLKDRWNITYICWDHSQNKILMNGVQVIYVDRSREPLRIFRFLREVLRNSTSCETILFIKNFEVMATLIKLCRWNNPIVFDIRSGSVHPNNLRRFLENMCIKLESNFFQNITVISKSLAVRLGLLSKCSILPLGADVISPTEKLFDKLRLLYVGTLYNRNLHKAIEGFAKYYQSSSDTKAQFTIIGTGPGDEENHLRKLVQQLNLENVIHVLGYIPHEQLKPYFESNNVGVSYIPITDYYDVQPATKTFEYLLSGLAVIGTATSENKLIINESNGILIGESITDFCNGLIRLSKHMHLFNSQQIRDDGLQNSWNIITDGLDSYLGSINQNKSKI